MQACTNGFRASSKRDSIKGVSLGILFLIVEIIFKAKHKIVFILVRDIVVILLPIMAIGFVLAAIRSGVQTFRGRDDDDDVNDGFLVDYGINL
ncbi:hypothetical protein [Helicobacter pylori]|uniref:hypothetical protein n=1 Tax=Helicobacter pylori TaxID=210 RepID=UPI0011AB1BD9|nr:hypothetical protein [Helicobacter pylori]